MDFRHFFLEGKEVQPTVNEIDTFILGGERGSDQKNKTIEDVTTQLKTIINKHNDGGTVRKFDKRSLKSEFDDIRRHVKTQNLQFIMGKYPNFASIMSALVQSNVVTILEEKIPELVSDSKDNFPEQKREALDPKMMSRITAVAILVAAGF
jgi:hypothetical protein